MDSEVRGQDKTRFCDMKVFVTANHDLDCELIRETLIQESEIIKERDETIEKLKQKLDTFEAQEARAQETASPDLGKTMVALGVAFFPFTLKKCVSPFPVHLVCRGFASF